MFWKKESIGIILPDIVEHVKVRKLRGMSLGGSVANNSNHSQTATKREKRLGPTHTASPKRPAINVFWTKTDMDELGSQHKRGQALKTIPEFNRAGRLLSLDQAFWAKNRVLAHGRLGYDREPAQASNLLSNSKTTC